MEPDENALLSYVYTDWFVKGLAAAGRDVTADKVAKALQTTGYDDKGLIFYGPKTFKANHIDPETVRVDQATGGRWVSVSDLLQ
jgi:hypothetical protein